MRSMRLCLRLLAVVVLGACGASPLPAGTCAKAADCSGSASTCCGTTCVDSASDVHNCGTCGKKCPAPANGAAVCTAGVCGVGTCDSGFLDCDHTPQNGCEVNGATSLTDCGACGNRCVAGPNQTVACVAGTCTPTCSPGFAHCSANAADGCEVHTAVDLQNCGGCGAACGPLANAVPACKAGVCTVSRCMAPFLDCDATASNGCEVNPDDDVAHCGGCGTACQPVANGTAACVAGKCGVGGCSAGFGDCDVLAANGCEANVTTDLANCGVCGNACVGAGSVQACSNSVCTVVSCDVGKSDCNKVAADGCEAATATDPANCGACGTVCAVPANASASCAAGVCGIGKCVLGFLDCDKSPVNGCEANKLTDLQNCGVCGHACVDQPNATATCKGGTCAIAACSPNFSDCDKLANDGCEVAQPCCAKFDSDPNNCGACGNVCPKNTPYCIQAVCGNTTHSISVLSPDAVSDANAAMGDASVWHSQDMGPMTYDDCELTANQNGAQFMGETGFFGTNYDNNTPYARVTRWVGEADEKNGWTSTQNWSQVNSTPKDQVVECVLAYANGDTPGVTTFDTTWVSDNGKTYQVNDLGDISEKTCYTSALDAGARPLNPWMFVDATQTRAHMSENHVDHGSTQYTGKGSYTNDGQLTHTYRCLIGYNNN